MRASPRHPLSATAAAELLRTVRPVAAADQQRKAIAGTLIADIRRLKQTANTLEIVLGRHLIDLRRTVDRAGETRADA